MKEIEVDVVNDTTEPANTEGSNTMHDADDTTKEPKENASQTRKFVRLPLARIKSMMKLDPTCKLIGQDAVFLATKATEMFIEYLAKEAGKEIGTGKRKTLMRRDIDSAIEHSSQFCFLDGALE